MKITDKCFQSLRGSTPSPLSLKISMYQYVLVTAWSRGGHGNHNHTRQVVGFRQKGKALSVWADVQTIVTWAHDGCKGKAMVTALIRDLNSAPGKNF